VTFGDVPPYLSEEQIIGFLKEVDAGIPVKELCRKHGFSEASYYPWRLSIPTGAGDAVRSLLMDPPSYIRCR
jgi:transposase-like protein